MAASNLTPERLRELLDYDPATGIFTWRVSQGNKKAGQLAGGPNGERYIHIRLDGERHKAHRLAWLYVRGEWPRMQIDHWDEDRTNNRFKNLRDATQSKNMHNQRASHANNKAGRRGVSWDAAHNKYTATLRLNKRTVFFKRFATLDEADAAYRAARERFSLDSF